VSAALEFHDPPAPRSTPAKAATDGLAPLQGSMRPLGRFPTGQNYPVDKKSLQIQKLSIFLWLKSLRLERNML